MPFKSKAQARACYAKQDPDWDCDEWASETDFRYLKNSKDEDSIYREWKGLVNMTARELQDFAGSNLGKKAGLSREEASRQGIRSGQDSAKAIIRMKHKHKSDWTASDWDWARRQIAFIKRMRGVRGHLLDKKGEPTRKLLALLIWGHNPL